MSYSEMCKHGSGAPKDVLESLPDYQGKTGRHKCVVCAYQAGIEEGFRRANKEQQRTHGSRNTSSN
jgi:hypothetical protein